jgi:hypothetical protein
MDELIAVDSMQCEMDDASAAIHMECIGIVYGSTVNPLFTA